ncbi:stemmadenine O-acetyltransferase-like isoform X2 [Mercurialis annua]|uniref:stemmadenine O-acetyltransferase-like isoform X2 n=1 Tax=Mercurialis annua TaxID=3986 RepID=UPI00215DE13E|nr:stemmadenine O-acetyltransferase-like isoform X2 [Mercurialis annua]
MFRSSFSTGEVKDDLYINCNDNGVFYTEAKISCCLLDILGKPDSKTMFNLLPGNSSFMEWSGNRIPVAMIQVNIFKCGGVAIGTKTSHKIIDGPTSTAFLKAWAAIARQSGERVQPCFIAPTLFPQNHTLPKDTLLAIWPSLIKFGKGVTKRFLFDSSSLAILKTRAASSFFVHRPTRVEAVSAFVWQCFMLASEAKHGRQRPSFLSLIMNLRGKHCTKLPNNSIGNLLWMTIAQCNAETNRELNYLVGLLRKSVLKIDGDFIKNLSGEEGFSKICECLQEFGEIYSNEEADYLTFSSLCNVGIYETDFGWGKPIWVSPGGITGPVFQNLVFLNETSVGDGIEVWLTLDEQDMNILESDTEILSFSNLDPSPLS